MNALSNGERPFSSVVCVGLDGATFDVIDPMIERGRLPTLGKILSEGTRSKLASVVPPLSAPAWVSFMTGLNPGRHGIFHFISPDDGGDGGSLAGSWQFRGQTIFDLASRDDLKVVAFRVPMTYPPWPINGPMISGFPTPDPRRTYAYPEEMADTVGQLLKLSPIRSMVADVDAQVENFEFYLRRSTDALTALMKPDVDLVCYVNSITDWVAHKFWRYSDPSAPGFERRDQEGLTLLEYFYEKTDESLASIVAAAPDDALIVVLSDHGTGPRSARRFNTNAWLTDVGLLVRDDRKRGLTRAASMLEWIKDMVPKKYWLWRHSPAVMRRSAQALRSYGGAIDWGASKAYAVRIDHHVEGVKVNLVGREPRGMVPVDMFDAVKDEIISSALALKDPSTGTPVFEGACRREELYAGPHVSSAPDVILTLSPRYEFGIGAERRAFTSVPISRLGRSSATHRPDGILAVAGPNVKRADLGRAELLDVPPTILWALGLPVPDNMDGRLLTGAFEDDLLSSHPVRRAASTAGRVSRGAYTKEEEEQMTAHLEDLGYV